MKLERIKKIIILVVFLATGLMVQLNSSKFIINKTQDPGGREVGQVNLVEHPAVVQKFTAKDPHIFNIFLPVVAPDYQKDSGSILLELYDTEDNMLAADWKYVRDIQQTNPGDSTNFVMETNLEPGKEYILIVRGVDLVSKKGVFLSLGDSSKTADGVLKFGSKKQKNVLRYSTITIHYERTYKFLMLALVGCGIVFLFLPFKRSFDKKGLFHRWMSRALFVISPIVAFFIVQRYAGYGLLEFARMCTKTEGLVNLFLYYMMFFGIYLIINRSRYTACLLVLLTSFFGLANYYVWNYRGTPIVAADLSAISTAKDVAAGYSYSLNYNSMWGVVCTILFVGMVLSLKNEKGLPWKKRVGILAVFATMCTVFYTQILHGKFLQDHNIALSVWDSCSNYAENGSVLSAVMSYMYYVVEEPEGYSVDRVQEILKNYESDSVDHTKDEKRPNVIVIMNESFANLSVLGDCEPTEDYMPFFHSLKENTVKGNLQVSAFGGGTCNSEFEFLTGCDMAFMPYMSMPYNDYIDGEFPSITYTMKEKGYTGNMAIHPGTDTAWNRNVVYPYLGFDTFYSMNDMTEDVEYLRGMATDASDYQFLIHQYEASDRSSDQPFYAFNVTIQNHGGYGEERSVDMKLPIRFKDENLNKYPEVIQYINLIKESDTAFKDLISYFSEVKEDTIILMFGDHQPSIPKEFFERVMGVKEEDFTVEDLVKQYTVPYVIWANYDIEEEETDLSDNYLSAYLTRVMGGELTAYQKYLLDLRKDLPVITANSYMDSEGGIHEIHEKSEYANRLKEYQILQYNNMIDWKNRVQEKYFLKE